MDCLKNYIQNQNNWTERVKGKIHLVPLYSVFLIDLNLELPMILGL